jgi:hypothetical protein
MAVMGEMERPVDYLFLKIVVVATEVMVVLGVLVVRFTIQEL